MIKVVFHCTPGHSLSQYCCLSVFCYHFDQGGSAIVYTHLC